MKKEILIFALVATMSVKPMVMEATPEKVHVGIHIDDPTGPFPMPRTPALLPGIYIDGHTLSFDNLWGNYTLTLYDEEGDVAYTACLPAGTTQIVLPTTLSGNFEIRLEADTYYYYGYILL